MKPINLNLKKETLLQFQEHFPVALVVDKYKEQLEELFLVRNPQFRFNLNYQKDFKKFYLSHTKGQSLDKLGQWFYFPWNKILTHYLDKELHQEIRTARNKNLITEKEQDKLYNSVIGIAGLSIGSHIALTLVMMGIGKTMRLADPDKLSATNLNRVRYDFTKLGINKSVLAAQQIHMMNPYAKISLFKKGITKENIKKFLAGPPKLNVLIEETDNLEMKILLRLEAKKLRIPVIMATDNGDNVIIDIERYDLMPSAFIFNGALGDLTINDFKNFEPEELPKLSAKIAGEHLAVQRMKSSLAEVGKTLYSWPQLGNAATLSGAVASYLTKKIILGEKIKLGKLEVNLDKMFGVVN